MAEIKVTLRRIEEETFGKNDAILNDASIALAPQFSFELMSDIKKDLLTIVAQIVYITTDKQVAAGLRFRYTVEVNSLKNLEHVSNPEKGTHDYKFPDGLIEMMLTDVYATGRILMAQKLKGTRLEHEFLPFGGAGSLIQRMKR